MNEDIEKQEIRTIMQFYQYLDQNAIRLRQDYQLVPTLASYKEDIVEQVEKEFIEWEIEFFLFDIRGGYVFPLVASHINNKVSEFPNKLDIKRKTSYLKKRAENSESNLLKARYLHLLWLCAETKHKKYAVDAIKSYAGLIEDYFVLGKKTAAIVGNEICSCFELVSTLSAKVNHLEEVLGLKSRILFTEDLLDVYEKLQIIETMLTFPKVFKAKDFKNIPELLDDVLEENLNGVDDYLLVEFQIPTALKVASKLNLSPKQWHEMSATAYLRLARHDLSDNKSFGRAQYLAQAVRLFGLAGNLAEKKKAEQLYFELKPDVKLDTFIHELSEESIKILRESNEELKNQAIDLLKLEQFKVYKYLSTTFFFPKYSDAEKAATRKSVEPFLQFAKTIYFDSNKNVKYDNKGDLDYTSIVKEYGSRVEETLISFLHYTFFYGIRSGHLTHANFLQYIIEKTWIGKPHFKLDLGGNPIETNWVNLIAPSVMEFFKQIMAWGASNYYQPNFILCIDSLTIKLEGLFRNFSERLNISTSEGKEKGMQEVLLHKIFKNNAIKEYFDKEDLLLFDYVFSNEYGLNIRNNVAHCFYNEQDYSYNKMLLLFMVLLRLGKYNIQPK